MLLLATSSACAVAVTEETPAETCGPAPVPPDLGIVEFDGNHAIMHREQYVALVIYRFDSANWATCRQWFDAPSSE